MIGVVVSYGKLYILGRCLLGSYLPLVVHQRGCNLGNRVVLTLGKAYIRVVRKPGKWTFRLCKLFVRVVATWKIVHLGSFQFGNLYFRLCWNPALPGIFPWKVDLFMLELLNQAKHIHVVLPSSLSKFEANR